MHIPPVVRFPEISISPMNEKTKNAFIRNSYNFSMVHSIVITIVS